LRPGRLVAPAPPLTVSEVGQRGVSRVFVARFVNDRGGPGRWRARWIVDGETVASWRFRVRPEFG
jgi:hypothetical protein